jgi:hypothetical protein
MQFLSMHGIDVVARTGDVNLSEKLALDVTSATMRDLMQAIAAALDARWTRYGNIFVLCRSDVAPGAGAYVADFKKPDGSALNSDDDDAPPSAIVSTEGRTDVHPGSISRVRDTYTVELNDDGEWRVTNSSRAVDTQSAHVLKPKLSIHQRRTLAHRGFLKLEDLTQAQIESLGEVWPDGNYHAKSGSKSLVIRP